MGKSAIAAAESLKTAYSIPYARIELTPMIGGNDVTDEHFTLADAQAISSYSLQKRDRRHPLLELRQGQGLRQGLRAIDLQLLGGALRGTLGFFKTFLSALGLASA